MNPIAFSGNPLDRASYRRTDPAWLAMQAANGLFLPFWQNRPFVVEGRAGFMPMRAEWENTLCVFLGLDGEQPLFAVDLPGDTEPVLEGGSFAEMRAAAFTLPARDIAIAGQAKALLDWHKRHGFCPNCGHATAFADAGYKRTCPQCGAEHFPRTDPVVIMLPVFGDECLIGRNLRFPPLLFSAFAGFVEPGETMEEAVRRELLEEVELKVGAVTYHATQPWPFPSSLMLGCYAQALNRDFRIDGHEIEAARWLSKDEVRARLANGIEDEMRLPAPIAIAHHLIRDWAHK
ncbi:MAG TPA: NAD(+) diphosphatase [Rhizomicrobium sp.]|jgi:NAD+ diphosphatase|nr:NAD(+) diphosphatase [Rhizomicrobium sp.]